VAELPGLRVGLFGLREVAASSPDLADLVDPRGGNEVEVAAELVARLNRLLLGAVPVALEPHDLRPVDAAGAGEAAHVEPVAPAVRRRRPFGSPAAVAKRLTGVDGHAVDHSGRQRLELAADGGGRRFVEDSEPFAHLARHDLDRPLEHHRHRLEVAIAETGADVMSEGQVLLGTLELSHHHRCRPSREREMPVLDAFRLVLEEPRRAREPAARDRS
jgi:hypothetical protein